MDKSYKVFVGGLPVRVDRDAVAEFFAAYGTVLNCKLKKNQQTGRSLGFAYLTVKEKATYDRLLAETVVFQGRVIDVKPMWKKKELGDKLEEEKKKKIFVSNLPQDLTNPELMAYFSRFGQVLNAFIIKDPDTEGYKDYGYVVFKDINSINSLINQADDLVIRGNRLLVECCTNAAQIAISKQTSSLKGSKQSSA
jgi:RNA-binding protein Musashi